MNNFRIYGTPPSPGVYNDTKSWGVSFGGALKPWRNKAEKFAGEICRKDLPQIRQTKSKNSPQIRSAEPRDQKLKHWPSRKSGNDLDAWLILSLLVSEDFYFSAAPDKHAENTAIAGKISQK